MHRSLVILLFVLLFVVPTVGNLPAQGLTELRCGDILSDVTFDFSNRQVQEYAIELQAGDTINATIEQVGNVNDLDLILFLDEDRLIGTAFTNTIEISVSASDIYTIRVDDFENRIGTYTLTIGCTLRDGTVIPPGSVAPEIEESEQGSTAEFSGFGIPTLAPVDFSAGVTVPMTLGGAANVGSISEEFVGIFGYTFEGSEGQPFSLQFTRTAGNLNLGIAVITASNEVAFQASLVNSNVLITQFNLPATDTYTIGVYRIELNPPHTPEATSFEITGTLN